MESLPLNTLFRIAVRRIKKRLLLVFRPLQKDSSVSPRYAQSRLLICSRNEKQSVQTNRLVPGKYLAESLWVFCYETLEPYVRSSKVLDQSQDTRLLVSIIYAKARYDHIHIAFVIKD